MPSASYMDVLAACPAKKKFELKTATCLPCPVCATCRGCSARFDRLRQAKSVRPQAVTDVDRPGGTESPRPNLAETNMKIGAPERIGEPTSATACELAAAI